MNFLELIAAALDDEGIESRFSGDALFVPISPDVDLRFEDIESDIPAANVYVAVADAIHDEDATDDEAMLVTAIFTVDDAVETVNFHVATDQAVTIIRDLIDGSDARIADLDFVQDDEDSTLLVADVGESSSLEVVTTVESSVPSIRVAFVTYIDSEVQEDIDPSVDGDDAEVEVMDLGVFADYDTVFNVLSVAVDQADSWEAELIASATDPWGSEVRDPWGDTV